MDIYKPKKNYQKNATKIKKKQNKEKKNGKNL
jgi:hypothetical protein